MAAFGNSEGPAIVQLIADLLVDASAQPVLSLVATADEAIVGHILFTKASVRSTQRAISAALLAPLAVHPDVQSQGIGGRLIMEGLDRLSQAGIHLVFVLGHPTYYPRYGFSEAGVSGFEAPYPIHAKNAGAWMVKELQPGIIGVAAGPVACADAIDDPRYWRE